MRNILLLIALASSFSFVASQLTNTTTSGPATTTTEAPPGICPEGWIDADFLGCFYFDFSQINLSWEEAMDSCDRMGGYLAEIKTEEQADFIVSIDISENL